MGDEIMIQAVVLICGLCVGADAPTTKSIIPPAVAAKEPSVEVWEGYYRAELNTQYHQGFASYYHALDTWARFMAILLGVVSLVAPFMFALKNKWARGSSAGIAFVALTAALVLTFWNYGNLYETHHTLAIRWLDLANDWNLLRDERDKLPETELLARVHSLRAKQTAIEQDEPVQSDEAFCDCARVN
jgi:hypothetical protein